jgi:glycosyltransferase involved in cell wall biosynthesis
VKIVFIITGLEVGGAENMLLRLVRGVDKAKFTPVVISLSSIGEIGREMISLGIPVKSLGIHKGIPNPMSFFRLIFLLRKIKPDIVHTWLYHSDLIGGWAAKIAKVPFIIWGIRSADFLNKETSFSTRITLILCAWFSSWLPDLVIYNSQKGRLAHKDFGYKEPLNIVLPNGIDLQGFKPSYKARLDIRGELEIPMKAPVIGLIGRFDPLKNHKGFLEAAWKLNKVMPDAHFIMAGQGVNRDNPLLLRCIEGTSLESKCHFLGKRQDIPKIMAALDLVTLASLSEAFPNVLIEAMACGVPCVSTDAGDAALIVASDNWIVPIGDMDALAAKWRTFFQLPASERHALSDAARNRVNKEFEIGAVICRFETMYLNVLSGRLS